MHVRTIPFGRDNPHHIVHEPSLKVYGIACKQNEPTRIGDYEASKSTFQLIDDSSLTGRSAFRLVGRSSDFMFSPWAVSMSC